MTEKWVQGTEGKWKLVRVSGVIRVRVTGVLLYFWFNSWEGLNQSLGQVIQNQIMNMTETFLVHFYYKFNTRINLTKLRRPPSWAWHRGIVRCPTSSTPPHSPPDDVWDPNKKIIILISLFVRVTIVHLLRCPTIKVNPDPIWQGRNQTFGTDEARSC